MGAHRKHPPAGAAKTIEDLAAQGHAKVGIAKRFGVSSSTLSRWCEEEEALQEAFEIGRETERQALHSLIAQAAITNKPANANAMFLLKTRHGYREQDSPKGVSVDVKVATNVLVVNDHGSDAEWEAKAAQQQAALVMDTSALPALPSPRPEASSVPVTAYQEAAVPSYAPPDWNHPTWRRNT